MQNKDNGVKEGGINDGEFHLTIALSPGRCGSVDEEATLCRYPATVLSVGGSGERNGEVECEGCGGGGLVEVRRSARLRDLVETGLVDDRSEGDVEPVKFEENDELGHGEMVKVE